MSTDPVVVLILDEAEARDYLAALGNEAHACRASDPDRQARFLGHWRPMRGSGVDAAERAGLSIRQVNYYLRTKLLVPRGLDAAGSGSQRALTDRDVDALAVLGRLMRLTPQGGHSLRPIRDRFAEIAAHVQDHGPVGTFELIPGVTVDLERLVATQEAAA